MPATEPFEFFFQEATAEDHFTDGRAFGLLSFASVVVFDLAFPRSGRFCQILMFFYLVLRGPSSSSSFRLVARQLEQPVCHQPWRL